MIPRREFHRYALLRPDALYFYGGGAMTNQEIQVTFSKSEPKSVERVNWASCNAIFEKEGVPSKVIDELKVGLSIDNSWF